MTVPPFAITASSAALLMARHCAQSLPGRPSAWDFFSAARAVRAISQAGLYPSNCRIAAALA